MNPCDTCGKPTTAGITCFACSARIVEAQRKLKDEKLVRIVVDGQAIIVPASSAHKMMGEIQPICPQCEGPMNWQGARGNQCRWCGYKEGES